jgi:hypothetical protein
VRETMKQHAERIALASERQNRVGNEFILPS